MNPALWGGLSALSLGSSDFASRFSARALGADVVYLAVLAVGSILLSCWVFFTDVELVWRPDHAWLLFVNGAATVAMTVLLYAALARGPVSVVAPIVAAHPVLVVLAWFVLGARPALLEWICMAGAIAGVVLVARSKADDADQLRGSPLYFRQTILMALAACVFYTVMVVAGQAAIPTYGEVQTVWLGRILGFVLLALLFFVRRKRPSVPVRWWPFLIAQGCLDAGGYLFLFAGSDGPGREVAAVAASGFGVVTTLLGRFVLKEPIAWLQWLGILLVFVGIGILSGQSV